MTDGALVTATGESGRAALVELVVASVSSVHSQRAYRQGLTHFFAWYDAPGGGGGFARSTVQRYRAALEAAGLAPSTINVRLAALRKLAAEAMETGWLDAAVGQGVARVKGAKSAGVRRGNWLTKGQAEALLALPQGDSLQATRDRALLCLLVGCGLRRTELAALTVDHVQQREGRWVLLDLVGKGQRVRTVPMPGWAKAALDRWSRASGITSGMLFRPINKADVLVGDSLTPQAVYAVVAGYSERLGVVCTTHDLRRTFAQLAHKGHAPLEQIQLSLGHASIQTTERYLGVQQDLQDAPCDHLGLRIG